MYKHKKKHNMEKKMSLRFGFRVITIVIFLNMVTQVNASPIFKGDIRYRNDRTDEHAKDSRFRHRIRGRLGAYGKVQEDISYAFRFVTGSTDPVSTNETLDSGFSTKNANFDLISLKYRPKNSPYTIIAGKYKNQFVRPGKTELIWDGDLTTEGINLGLDFKPVFVKIGYLWLEERSSAADTILQGVQIGMKKDLGPINITLGGSYFDYLSIKGKDSLFDSTSAAGNSSTTSGSKEKYDNDYNLIEGFVEVKVNDFPLTFLFDYVQNTEAKKDDTGWLVGAKIGKKLKISYNYRIIEKDAVVGAFTDSDFKGGGTDGKGHEMGLSYPIGKYTKVAVSHFINKTAVKNGKNYNRSFLDLSVKF